MNWEQLLTDKRFGLEDYHDKTRHDRTVFQRDYDRLVFSPPFRRLQNKTQVFPLPGSVFVHNRLTHSLEVACVGRSLAYIVSRHLYEKYRESSIAFDVIGSIVATACLAHDLGNPPFGHSGEKAIGNFFDKGKGKELESSVRQAGGRWEDFVNFEGNANSIRLLTHQFQGRRPGGFTMSYPMLASIVKYPYTSMEGKGKLGFFQPEEDNYRTISSELGIPVHSLSPLHCARYPLVFLVEAADDICYKIMDIEDAFKLHLLSFEEVKDLFFRFFDKKDQRYMEKTMQIVDDLNEKIAYMRSKVIGVLVDQCAEVFISKEEEIMQGAFNDALIKHIAPLPCKAYEYCTEISIGRIYSARDALDVELAGHRIIGLLLEACIDAIQYPKDTYSKLLLARIPQQYEVQSSNIYTQILAVIDYISGMTDIFALDLYRKITGMSLPAV